MIIHDLNQIENQLKNVEWVFIEFSSPGCAPCKRQLEILTEIVNEYSSLNLALFEIDITKYQAFTKQYKVLSVPTLILFKNGTERKRYTSLQKKETITSVLQNK